MGKLEVGQYWHDPKDGDEWLVKEENKDGKFTCECVSSGETAWFSGEIVRWYYDELIELDYVLGRHPDNIEQWQLKEGDLVWNKVQEFKAKVVQGLKGELYYLAFDDYGCERMYSGIQRIKNLFEPYAGQDKKIDFSKAGQWLRNAEDGLICTFGELGRESEILFLALPFGAEYRRENTRLYNTNVAWQLLTREQINPILEAIDKALRESQSD